MDSAKEFVRLRCVNKWWQATMDKSDLNAVWRPHVLARFPRVHGLLQHCAAPSNFRLLYKQQLHADESLSRHKDDAQLADFVFTVEFYGDSAIAHRGHAEHCHTSTSRARRDPRVFCTKTGPLQQVQHDLLGNGDLSISKGQLRLWAQRPEAVDALLGEYPHWADELCPRMAVYVTRTRDLATVRLFDDHASDGDIDDGRGTGRDIIYFDTSRNLPVASIQGRAGSIERAHLCPEIELNSGVVTLEFGFDIGNKCECNQGPRLLDYLQHDVPFGWERE